MIDKPIIAQTKLQAAAVIHLTVSRSEIRVVIGPAYEELVREVNKQGFVPSGPWFTHHLRFPEGKFDFEIGFPIEGKILPAGRVKPGILPAVTVARTVYHGGYEELAKAWAEFDSWIEKAGYIPAGDLWECFAVGPESNPDPKTWRTELNRPVTKIIQEKISNHHYSSE